jgi:archaellum biogenesis ATPase FlaH
VVKNHLQVNGTSIVLVDCLDYLKAVNGFQAAFVALSQVADIVADVKGVLIVSVRPSSFEEAELSLLESTMEVLGLRSRPSAGYRSARCVPTGASTA